MKKLFALILAIVYLSSTVGATVHVHFCMNKLVNWSLNDDGNKCKNCGMEKDGNCCKDESKFVKNSLDQTATGAIQLLLAPTTDPVAFMNVDENYSSYLTNEYPANHAPPIKTGIDILVRNCIFRI